MLKIAIVYNKKLINEEDVINVFGVTTKEHYSPKTIEKAARSLERGGHTVKVIEGGMSFIDEMRDFMPRVVAGDRPGMVFNMAYGIQGRNRYTHVPAMLEMLGIPYVGSGPEAHAVVQDKGMTKLVLQKNGIPTAAFWVFSTADDTFDDLTFPVIVKPKMESTSMGMKVVDNWPDLREAVREQIEKYSQDILVEQFIPGREFAVGILGNGTHAEVLPIVEFNFHGDPNKIQTKSDKMTQPVEKICPAVLSEEQERSVRQICLDSFHKLGLNDFCRVDLRMDHDNRLYVLELNSMASLGTTGSFVHSAKVAGYTYDSLINKILETAAMRYFGESYLHSPESATEGVRSQPLRTVVRSYLRSHLTTNEQLLEHLVNVNSSTYNVEDVNKLGEIITRRLEHMGFKTQRYHEFDVGDMIYSANHSSDTNDILFLSHLDTWYENRDFAQFHRMGNKLFGSGVAESKGGLVAMLSALQALRFARKLKKIRCGILLISDDHLGGRSSKKLVRDVSERSRHVVDLKWGMPGGGVATTCSGTIRYGIDMVHVRRPNETTKDVIPDMCKKLIAWKKISYGSTDARMTVFDFSVKTSFGSSPDYGRLTLGSRYSSFAQGEDFDARINKIAKTRTKSKLDVHVVKQVTRDPVEAADDIMRFYERVQSLAAKADIKIQPAHRFATSSLCDVPSGMRMLGSMGPIGYDHRTPNEHILRDSLVDRGLLLALVAHSCAEPDGERQ